MVKASRNVRAASAGRGWSSFVALAVATVGAIAGRVEWVDAGTQVFSPTFETNKQSIWGTGQAAVSIDLQNQFLGARWGQPDQGGPKAGQISYGNYVNGNGFLLRGETSGRIGLEYGLKIDSGSIDASLPWDISVTTPNANTLVTGQTFIVDTSATFRANDATFTTRSPTFQMYSDFVFDVKARLLGQASMDLLFLKKQISFDKQILDVSARQELLAINRDNDGEIRVLPFLFSAASTAKEAYDNAQATKELKQELDKTTGRREKVKVTLRKVGVSFDLGSPVEASIRLPYVQMDGSKITRDGNKIRQSDKDGFAEFTFDLDRIASIAVPQIPPMTINADLDLVVGTLSTSATLVDVDFVPTLNLTQTAEVNASGVKIDLDLGKTRGYRVLAANGSVVSSNLAGARFVTLDAGQKLELTYDGTDMNLLPTYRVDAALQNQFGLSISSQLQFRALMASLEAKLFGLDLGGFSIGPAFETAIDFPDISLGNLFDKTFALQGFNSAAGPAIFISDKPATFTGPTNSTWSINNNWTVGSTVGINPDIGRSAIVPTGKTVNVTGTNAAAFHLEIASAAQVNVNGTLTLGGSVYSSGAVNLAAGSTLSLVEDPTVEGRHILFGGTYSLASGSQILVVNNINTSATNPDVTVTNTTINLDNASINVVGGGARLFLANGATLNVTNSAANAANLSVIGRPGDYYGFDIVRQGTKPVTVNLTQGGNLLVDFSSISTVYPDQNPTPDDLKSASAPILSDMLTFNVGTGSTLSLRGAPTSTGLSGFTLPGTLRGARFITAGSGVVKNVGTLYIAASRFDGNFVADAADNPAGVLTNFTGLGSTVAGQAMPVVNNGTMKFIARPGVNSDITTDGGVVAGTGEMQLIGYSNPVRLLYGGAATFTNDTGHTIRADNARIGSVQTGNGSFRFYNNGTFIADKNFGSGTGFVTFDNGSDPVNGNIVNTGLLRAQNGAQIASRDNNYILNTGAVEVGDLSTANLWASTYNLSSPNASTLTLTGGSWKTEYSGRLIIAGNALPEFASILSNKSSLEVSANFASASAGIYVRVSPSRTIRVEQFATFRNEAAGDFRVSTVSTVNFADFENYGALDISNSTITGVQNYTSGLIFGSGEVRMQQTSPGVAAVSGFVVAMPSENNSQLTVSAAPGVTTLQNNGTMGAMGADLVFPSGLIVASTGGTLTGGKWVVEGGTAANPASARIIIPLSGGNLTALTNTSVTLSGPLATLDSSNNGVSLRSFRTTLTTLNSGGILSLDSTSQTFANRITINTGGQLLLSNGATVGGTGFDVYGLIEGNGTISAPIKTFGGTVNARNGLLTITSNIDNTAVVGGFSGTILANDPGAVLNPKGATFTGGRLIINSIGAGLYGSGSMAPATFQSKGVVAADTGTLDFTGNGSFTNTGMMTTRERGVLQFSGGMTLTNTGGTVSAVDTGGLDLQSDGGGIGGTVRLKGATISGGSVLISGYATYAGGRSGTNTANGVNAKLDGYGSLQNLSMRIDRGTLTVDPVLVPGGTDLNITPATGVPAVFYASTINVSNGGNLNLNVGTFAAIGSTITVNNNSALYLFGARLEDARLATTGSGQVRVAGVTPATMANVKNTGYVSVFSGGTLNVTGTIDSRGGTISSQGTIVMNDCDLVGGTVFNNPSATIRVPGRAQILGSNLVNYGTIRIDATGDFTAEQSNDGTATAASLSNFGTMSIAGKMKVNNSSFTTTGNLTVDATGSLTARTLVQNAGIVRVNGTASVANYYLNAGTLYGAGRVTGSLYNYGGSVQPGNSPGTLTVDGDLISSSDSEYVMQVEYLDTYDKIVSLDGDMHLQGRLILDFSSVLPEALGAFLDQQVSFQMFEVAPGHTIYNDGLIFEVVGDQIAASNLSFDPTTGSLSVFVGHAIPEPATLGLLTPVVSMMSRRRRSA